MSDRVVAAGPGQVDVQRHGAALLHSPLTSWRRPCQAAGVRVEDAVVAEGRADQGLVSAATLRRAGISRSAVARAIEAGVLLRVRRRVYSLEPLPALPRFLVTDAGVDPAYVAHVRAVLLSPGPSATAAGRTAAALYGWGMLVEPGRTLEVAVPHGRYGVTEPLVRAGQRRSLVRVRRDVLAGTAPMWTTSPVQTVVDCALGLPLLPAVVLCDSALRSGDVTIEELAPWAARLGGVREAHRVRAVLDLCDPLSGSVLETVLRVRMVLAGMTGFTTQRVLRDLPGSHLRVDFCFAGQASSSRSTGRGGTRTGTRPGPGQRARRAGLARPPVSLGRGGPRARAGARADPSGARSCDAQRPPPRVAGSAGRVAVPVAAGGRRPSQRRQAIACAAC